MTTQKLPIVDIYSDGWANPNPGPGGYGVIMKSGKHQKDFSQGYERTTNNRMELMGAITGFQKLKTRSQVVLHTDSQYTINGLQKWWAQKWKANNWIRTGNKKAQNWDLWKILLEEVEKHDVTFEWIKWHNGHPENEICDELATLAMQKDNLLIDEGYEEKIVQSHPSWTSLNSGSAPANARVPLQGEMETQFELTGTNCKKCDNPLVKKYPKHTKKTLTKQNY